METIKKICNQIFHPSKWILLIVPFISFITLIFIFAANKKESILAYFIYFLSAYSLTILIAAVPKLVIVLKSRITNSRILQYLSSFEVTNKYLSDIIFRGTLSIYQGILVNFFYTVFRIIVGIRYTSAWFISMAVYYFILGIIRVYLIMCYKKNHFQKNYLCYRNTAWFLFLLNIPMGGMIILMIRTNSGFSYPGYVIYLSALYTFYTMITAAINLVKFRKIGNPILSAAKVLNFISAMMSLLGLQTAMISQFSTHGENYRKVMNTITGGCVYSCVIIIAVYMLFHSRKIRRRDDSYE